MPAVTPENILVLPRIRRPEQLVAGFRPVMKVVTAPRQLEGAGFEVRRPFPNADFQDADPFLLLDQLGAVEYAPGEAKGAPWHPHRGFETVTYIMDGAFEHHDSTGGGGYIADGATQWMTAGAGIRALENTNDAHNAFFVHRNCIRHLGNKLAARPRTPLGYRTKIVGGKTANYSSGGGIALTERYYYDANGHIAYQMYYPGVDGVWPLHRYRLLWSWMFEKGILPGSSQERAGRGSYQRGTRAENALNEWQGIRLPSIAGKGTGRGLYVDHRWAVPVERDMTRMVYLCIERFSEKPSAKTRFLSGVTWPWRNWTKNFNFRYADLDAERTCQYDLPEYLSATDSTVVVIRKVLAEYARGVRQPSEEVAKGSREEELVTERNLRALESSTSINAPSIKEGLAKTGLPGFSE